MGKIKSTIKKLQWYFTSLPIVSTALFITVIICYKIRLERHFPDVALCVQPHMVMTGQASRLIKYVIHHKNVYNLLLSLGFLALFGTMAERQAGSIRYLFLMTLFAILSASLTVFFSILLGFSSRYSSLMYSCPALGLMPALFGITVLVFKSLPMKKTVVFFFMIPNQAVPWLLLILSQFLLQDTTFISNLSGCIIGSLYICSLRSVLKLPSSLVCVIDGIFAKIFKFIPILKYIPGAAPQLPLYQKDSMHTESDRSEYQQFDAPDKTPGAIGLNSVTPHEMEKLVQMGYSDRQRMAASTDSGGDVERAVSGFSNNPTSY